MNEDQRNPQQYNTGQQPMTTDITGRAAVKLLNASAARFGHRASILHKRDESRFTLMPKDKDLITVFSRAVKPVLSTLPSTGKVGVLVCGIDRADIPALLAEIEGIKWKWYAREDGSVLILPRCSATALDESHIETVATVARSRGNVRVGIGAIMHV